MKAKDFFSDCEDLRALKSRYRKLSKIYHPDNSITGDSEKMKEINEAYSYFSVKLEKEKAAQDSSYRGKTDEELKRDIQHFFEIFEILNRYENIEIEIIGVWVWVDGETKPIKEILKKLGFCWHSNKKKWYYAEPKDKAKSRFHKKEYNMDEIRALYGSSKFATGKKQKNAKQKVISS